ncbi:ABC transporter permease [Pyrinomonas methylaliphatogenes]|jgi:rhamnose transport system permease protein|uniref:Autoinducer 2 import system permease protein LsrC n=1 Tax=Pyrinomonas methylaliphatogenes TaxID=454194 RepID=A0A0B6WSI2_9BACT|nr:ABC transporter permease [Pyrinomonas methylaliphatogenes]CDM64178.1 monosaccharide ABC transporter membrane protein, CUT2 family [Pyrinomonas methylaliphatogenes]
MKSVIWSRYKRELAAAVAYLALLVAVGAVAPSFYSAANLRDLLVNNAPVLIVATGMTMVIIVREIDISVGSQFAVCSVVAGLLAKAGAPIPLLIPALIAVGAAMGALNGWLIGRLRIPSIIATLAMYVAWRDALRWATQGAWVQGLPDDFQWFGLGQSRGQWLIVAAAIALLVFFAWALRNLRAGRALYAVGSQREAARLLGLNPSALVFGVFTLMGALVGLAALLNAVRFATVPSNAGTGLELKAIASVVVGGTAISGGRGTLIGTLIGTALLGTTGTALTFAGINPFWEKAMQGAIILVALISEVALGRLTHEPR